MLVLLHIMLMLTLVLVLGIAMRVLGCVTPTPRRRPPHAVRSPYGDATKAATSVVVVLPICLADSRSEPPYVALLTRPLRTLLTPLAIQVMRTVKHLCSSFKCDCCSSLSSSCTKCEPADQSTSQKLQQVRLHTEPRAGVAHCYQDIHTSRLHRQPPCQLGADSFTPLHNLPAAQ